jgi:anaerobic magnesium-protoporphyrin IX monomethyl ester cyclase
MKCLLVKVPSNIHVILPPIGLGYVASYIKSKGKDIDVKILDCLKEKYGLKEFYNYIQREKPDIVGMTAFTMEIETVWKCARIIKEVNKNAVIVVGGPHITNDPIGTLENENIDFILKGEAEISFFKLIEEIKKEEKDFSNISNIGYMKDGEVIINKMEFYPDIDDLPFPDYKLIKFEEYPKLYFMKRYPVASIMTSRGCPYSCNFCSAPRTSGKKFRARSAKKIVEEIKFLKENYKIKEFQIWDDNFTLNKQRVIDFCALLHQEKINLPWWCPNGLRIETLDRNLIEKMYRAGCYSMTFGIESGSEKIQKDMNKNLDLQKTKEIIKIASDMGIRTQGFFILGYPTETREDILKTIKFSLELPLKRASFSLFQPLVGTEIYETLEEQGKLKSLDLNKCEYSKTSIIPQGLKSAKELKNLQRKAIFKFYIRPRILPRFIMENLSVHQFKELSLMFKKYIFDK